MASPDELETRLHGDFSAYVLAESERLLTEPDDIVRRAIALYSVLVPQLEARQQLVLRLSQPAGELPDYLRVDLYAVPADQGDLYSYPPNLADNQHVAQGLMEWPPQLER